jgi:formate hydrogenlyase subunit 3/multisubunit Na+/H+ antiporter MnhD subunit
MFQMDTGMNTFLMFIGSFTIIAAVMMALVQHDLKRLLGYHAVSQVGYMVLGIGTGNVIGIAGGLFHMLNHAIYKSCLFFSGGAVEKKQGTTDLDKLGGLAKIMPVTFITFLIASFAISGIPPFNGFASKWMVYQGVIKTAAAGGKLWVVWLAAAMFGSALTLASFMKLIHAVFLGQARRGAGAVKVNETGASMWLPQVTLAGLCIVFGVAYYLPLNKLIFPALGKPAVFTGMWNAASGATLLVLASMVIGIIIYFLGSAGKTRQTTRFVGGEILDNHPTMRLSGTEFYNTIQEIGVLKFIYRLARKKLFDVYEVGAKITFGVNKILSYVHNGVLSSYLAWCLLGMIILFRILLKGQ